MSRIGAFLQGAAVGAALMFGSLKYHVVRSSEGLHLVPKISAGFGETYVDVRKFGLGEWNEHRSLAMALVKSGKGGIMDDATTYQLRESLDGWLKGLYGDE